MPKPDDINSWEDLEKLASPRLKELGREDTPSLAVSAMQKHELVEVLARAYGFAKPQKAKNRSVIRELKQKARAVRKKRDEILAQPPQARDRKQLNGVRREIRRFKRKMRRQAGV